MIVFFLLNALAAASACLLASRVFRFSKTAQFSISFFLSYLALIVLSELSLGIFGQLTLVNLIMLQAALFLGLAVTLRRSPVVLPRTDHEKWLTALRYNRVLLLAVASIAGFGLVKIGINLINPPFGWDSLNYHFTFPVEWMKQANLLNPITVSDDPSPPYYPFNGSLFYLWLLWPFKSAFLADLGQVPFFLLGFFALYALAARMRLSREYSFLAASLFLLIPNYFKQLEIAYVDVMVSSLFLSSCLFLLEFYDQPLRRNALAFGISTGLLVGTKTVGLPYAALLIVPFVYICLVRHRAYRALALSLLSVVLCGGFSYIRNYLQTGNFLYPYELKIAGRVIFPGVMDTATYGAHFSAADYHPMKLLFHEGLGAATLVFALPAVLIGIPAAVWKRRQVRAMEFLMLSLPLLLYLVYRYLIPLANVRYLYPALAIGVVNGLYLSKLLGVPRWAIRILSVLCIAASWPELSDHAELAASLALTLLLLAVIPWVGRRAGHLKPHELLFPAAMAAGIAVCIFLGVFEGNYRANEYARYITMEEYSGFWPDATRAWSWLNEKTTGDNIAYVGRPVPYPLYGTSFKNNVYYVSVNTVEPARLHYYTHGRYRWGYAFAEMHDNLAEPDNYRGNADREVWLANMARRNTDYLFIYSLHQTSELDFPIEETWARSSPEVFDLVFENRTIRIYKIISSSEGKRRSSELLT